jgi:hypothetical protein
MLAEDYSTDRSSKEADEIRGAARVAIRGFALRKLSSPKTNPAAVRSHTNQ